MQEQPELHPTALVQKSRFGRWTVVGAHNKLLEVDFLDWSYSSEGVDIWNAEIGKFCNIASGVRINPTNHPMQRATLHHFTYRSRSHHMGAEDDEALFAWRRSHRVVIGPDVWIGYNAVLLPGVQVGTGAVIGAGSVVTKDVAPYTIVAGNPARPIRRRFDEATAERLCRIAWWDWPRERLAEALPDFRMLDGADFARRYDPAMATAAAASRNHGS
jgi:phosphonate metabolism protein (transferase hexapeptide repeat family)